MARTLDGTKVRKPVKKKTRQGAGRGTKKTAIKPYRGQGGKKRRRKGSKKRRKSRKSRKH